MNKSEQLGRPTSPCDARQRALLDYLTEQTSAGTATLEQTRLTKSQEQTQTETEQTGLTSNEYLLTMRTMNKLGNLNTADGV